MNFFHTLVCTRVLNTKFRVDDTAVFTRTMITIIVVLLYSTTAAQICAPAIYLTLNTSTTSKFSAVLRWGGVHCIVFWLVNIILLVFYYQDITFSENTIP